MDFGSLFHALAPRKLKDRFRVARLHLIKSKPLRLLVVRLWYCKHFLNLYDRYTGAPLLRHLIYIMTQSLNHSFLSAKSENPKQKLAKSAKAKIPTPPSFSTLKSTILVIDVLVKLCNVDLPHHFAMRYMQDTWL